MQENIQIENMKKENIKKFFQGETIGVVIACLILLLLFGALRMWNGRRYEKMLHLADQYMQELNYEDAELSYLKAISINEKYAKPYIRLSQIYLDNGFYDAAIEILRQGQDAIKKSEKEELDKQIQTAETVTGIEFDMNDNVSDSNDSEKVNEEAQIDFYPSRCLQEYDGIYHTALPINDGTEGFVEVEGSVFVGRLIVYKDKIYFDGGGTASWSSMDIMNLDGTNRETLLVDASAYGDFCIYENHLYCTTISSDEIYTSLRINLDTLEREKMDYFYYAGDSEVWIVANDSAENAIYKSDVKYYYCEPGYKNVRPCPPHEELLGVYDGAIYYRDNSSVKRMDPVTNEVTVVVESLDSNWSVQMCDEGLYYHMVNAKEIIYRYDMKTGIRETIVCPDLNWIDMYNEMNGKLYLSCELDPSTDPQDNDLINWKAVALDLNTKETKVMGYGFWQ